MISARIEANSYGKSGATTASFSPALPGWQRLGSLATSALLAEARLTPKPALVDERGSGAHDDLTLESMSRSALALGPFFQDMARMSWAARPTAHLREKLAACGREAEGAMLQATAGSNSHRGAIWCLGLLVASCAMHEAQASVYEVAETTMRLSTFADRYAPNIVTHGLFVRETYGIEGAKGEAQSGFPHVIKIGLPALRRSRLSGAPETFCRLDTLLKIMSSLDDTCLLYRGGLKALERAKSGAREIIVLGGAASASGMESLLRLDGDLLKMRASPGGSADLLAATLFLDSLGV